MFDKLFDDSPYTLTRKPCPTVQSILFLRELALSIANSGGDEAISAVVATAVAVASVAFEGEAGLVDEMGKFIQRVVAQSLVNYEMEGEALGLLGQWESMRRPAPEAG